VLESALVSSGESIPGLDDVPQRMRAVTLHVAESGTLLPLLHPGSRVDIQAVADRGGGVIELRRVVQDVEVVSTGSAEPGFGHILLPQVTVLVRPEQADIVALADTGSRVRLVLRNRQDRSDTAAPRLDLTGLFQGPLPVEQAPRPDRPMATAVAAPVPAPSETMHVRIFAAAPETVKQLGVGGSSWRILAIAGAPSDPGAGADLSSSDISFGASDTATVHAGSADCTVRIRLHLRRQLEISPELVWRDGESTRTASLEARVDPGSAYGFAIAGFNSALSGVLARAFPGRNLEGRELVVTIVPRHDPQAIARR
jgi:hypothetical protein